MVNAGCADTCIHEEHTCTPEGVLLLCCPSALEAAELTLPLHCSFSHCCSRRYLLTCNRAALRVTSHCSGLSGYGIEQVDTGILKLLACPLQLGYALWANAMAAALHASKMQGVRTPFPQGSAILSDFCAQRCLFGRLLVGSDCSDAPEKVPLITIGSSTCCAAGACLLHDHLDASVMLQSMHL